MAVQQANTELLPGYRLLEALGQGGFGAVWKCQAPGGLVKAIKVVSGVSRHIAGDSDGMAREARALDHIQSLRHPYLLSVDRAEFVDGDLLIVMELAERHLEELAASYRAKGEPGIPRAELLGYLREAAELLDMMNQQHNLQHLDIKPRNLFLFDGHVKVADFGLVQCLAELNGSQPTSLQLDAITPVYAAPESFLGKISPASDQYSVAVVYHELLTGKPPFSGKNFRQLAMQHMQAIPDLSALPEGDRPSMSRALAKEPQERFPTCSAFVQSLLAGKNGSTEMRVPARMFFALESDTRTPKLPTNHDILVNGKTSTATFPILKSTAGPPQKTSASTSDFAGVRLLECVNRQPNGELWRGLSQDGRKRLIRFVFDVDDSRSDEDPFARLALLQHDRLAKTEVVRDGPNRVGLVTEAGDENLMVRLKECMQTGMPGIPRQELLDYLAPVAAAIDALFEQHRLQHLSLSPRSVALVNGKSKLVDFGLAELFWIPSGQSPAAMNARYAAPELFDGQISRHVDQYSLALIFQEMLTGVHAFRNLNARQMASVRQRGNPDLGMLPSADRVLMLRALHIDPERRFTNCTEFLEALARATPRPKTPSPVSSNRLEVVKSPRIIAPSPRTPVVVVSASQVISDLVAAAAEGREVRDRNGMRFLVTPGVSILHHCCAKLLQSMVRLKLGGFREFWDGTLIEREGDERFLYHVPLPVSFWKKAFGITPSLGIEIRCEFPTNDYETMTEAAVEMWPLDCSASKASDILEEMGPRILESARVYLNAIPERRNQLRLPFEQTVQVAPVFDGEAGDPVVSKTCDISQRGMSVMMPCRPQSAQVSILVTTPARRDPVAISGKVVRVRERKDGRFEIGVAFA